MPASTNAPTLVVPTSPLTVYHRGFALAVLQTPGRYGARSFGFEVQHRGLLLHAWSGEYGTASEAEGGARRFVDDALRAFDLRAFDLRAFDLRAFDPSSPGLWR